MAYLGGAAGGVWKTVNDGDNWTQLFDAEPSLAMGAIAVDPNNGNVIWAGTGEANFGLDSYFGAGVFRSPDGGATWFKSGPQGFTAFDGCQISDIAVKQGDSKTILVAVSLEPDLVGHPTPPAACSTAGGSSTGIWRSTDAGDTWIHAVGTTNTSDLAADPADPTVWYAGDWQYGFLRSPDSGQTWYTLPANSGFPASTDDRGRVALGVAADGKHIYAAIENRLTGDFLGVWASTDGGLSWPKAWTIAGLCHLGDGMQCGYDLGVAVDPADATTFYVGGIYLAKFTNSGANGVYVGNDPGSGAHNIHVDFHALTFDAASPARLWVGSDGGVYRSDNGGSSFSNLNQDVSITEFGPGVSGSVGGVFLGGTQDNGSLRYSGSEAWTEVVAGDGGYSAVKSSDPNVQYASYVYLDVYRTTDGQNFTRVTPQDTSNPPKSIPCLQDPSCQFYAPMVMDPSNPRTLYAGTKRPWRTTDGWDTAMVPLASGPLGNGNITAIGPAASSTQTIYIGTTQGELFVSTNGGVNWPATQANGLPNKYITDVAVDPTTAANAFVSASGYGSGHVFKTANSGGLWTNVSGNLPDAPVNAVAIDTRSNPTIIYAGTDVGVFSSTNGGGSWARFGLGLPNTVVMDLRLDLSTNKLIAATHGRGVFAAPAIPPPTTKGRIVFQRTETSSHGAEIVVRNSDGTETQLTTNAFNDIEPVWSPDHTRIAFSSNRDGNYELYVMNMDGTNQTRLTSNAAIDEFPAWSPDGTKLAFSSNRDGNYEIYAMNSNGTGTPTRLTNNAAIDQHPAWSPDGTKIAFHSTRAVNYEIYVMNADGSSPTNLTNNPAADFDPAWSPDSAQIAFESLRDEPNPTTCGSSCNYEVYKAPANGGGPATRLTTSSTSDVLPSWSTDGAEITFAATRDGPYQIYKMNADGTSPVRLTSNPAIDRNPNWEPGASTSLSPYVAGVVGTNGGLYTLPSGATKFTADGGVLLGAPAVVSIPQTSGPGIPLYLGTGTNHYLYVRNDTRGWQPLTTSPFSCIDNPAGVVIGSTLYVACRGSNNGLWHAETAAPTGTNLPSLPFSAWQSLGGVLIAGPSVAAVAGTPTYVVVGTGNQVYQRTLTTGYTAISIWRCTGHPALASSGTTTYFACHGLDGALYYATNTGAGWSAAQSLGGGLIDGPGVAAAASGPIFFAEGTDHALYHRSISGPWVKDGGGLQYGAAAAAM